jgi:hypothetical protein
MIYFDMRVQNVVKILQVYRFNDIAILSFSVVICGIKLASSVTKILALKFFTTFLVSVYRSLLISPPAFATH